MSAGILGRAPLDQIYTSYRLGSSGLIFSEQSKSVDYMKTPVEESFSLVSSEAIWKNQSAGVKPSPLISYSVTVRGLQSPPGAADCAFRIFASPLGRIAPSPPLVGANNFRARMAVASAE
ncbi:MAG: hypothetical protein DMG49_27195 [Acidobacteria bacterium]|nr:MAG: hypothetical protein DMG49_27195 [Acidobacteriota bacterium]